MEKSDLQRLIKLIVVNASREDLSAISIAFQMRSKILNLQAFTEFKEGDRVYFTISKGKRKGEVIKGKITKMGEKNAEVTQDFFGKWKVSLGLLKKEAASDSTGKS